MKKVAVAVHATDHFDSEILHGVQGYDFIHVDVMDGKFVNNKNINLNVFKILKDRYNAPIIAHLMVTDPANYIKDIINYIDVFLFHFEITIDKLSIFHEIRHYNKNVGFAINPDTQVKDFVNFLKYIDFILIMGVNPGWSGQKFIPSIVDKVNELSKLKSKYSFTIDVDGGVTLENAKSLKNADILTSSSTILKAESPNEVIQKLKYIG